MTQNARVPNAVLVAGMISDSFEAERSVDRRDTLATGFKNPLYTVALSHVTTCMSADRF